MVKKKTLNIFIIFTMILSLFGPTASANGTQGTVSDLTEEVSSAEPNAEGETEGSPTAESQEAGVGFEDGNLEKLIRDNLNKPEGLITVEDMESLTSIEVNDEFGDITSLAGLEFASNLEKLLLENISVDTLDIIGSFLKLKKVYLYSLTVSNFDILLALPYLEEAVFANVELGNSVIMERLMGNDVNVKWSGHTPFVYIDVQNITENTADFTWGYSHLNEVDKYRVYLNEELKEELTGDISHLLLTNLDSSTDYSVRIEAIVGSETTANDIVYFTTSSEPTGKIINFPDPNLEKAIKEQLGISRVLYQSDMEQLNYLYADSLEINSLEGLQYAVNLEELSLNDNNLTNISPIDSLVKLMSLNVSGNKITELASLIALENLNRLDISFTPIEDINYLLDLKNISNISMMDTNVDLSEGTESMEVIRELEERGVRVDYGHYEVNFDLNTEVGEDTISATWSYKDITKVTEYQVYLNGELVAILDPAENSYLFENLPTGMEHIISIEAWGEEGHFSSVFSHIWLEEVSDISLYEETGIDFINLDWFYDGEGVVSQYEVYLGEQLIVTLDSKPEMNYLIEGLSARTPYEITINALNEHGEILTDVRRTIYTDSDSYVYFENVRKTKESIEVDWSFEGPSIDAFKLYVNSELVATVNSDSSSYTFVDLEGATLYNIEIEAVAGDEIVATDFRSIETDYDVEGKEITFNDSKLEGALREQLEIYYRDLKTGDLARLTHLYLIGYGIEDLTGLEHAVNVEYLNLNENEISDITVLSSFSKLVELDLNFNNIHDISSLSGLTNLRKLSLWENEITNIEALSKLINLYYLDIDDNQLEDISPLRDLVEVQTLYLSGNPLKDITVLRDLPKLETVGLNDTGENLRLNKDTWAVIQELLDRGIEVNYHSNIYVFGEGISESTAMVYWYSEVLTEEVLKAEIFVNGEYNGTVESLDQPYYMISELESDTEYEIELRITHISGFEISSRTNVQTKQSPEDMVSVTFRAVNSNGEPLSDLEFYIENANENSFYYSYGYTDANGYFTSWYEDGQEISLNEGDYSVTVFGKGNLEGVIQDVTITKELSDNQTMDIELKEYEKNTTDITLELVDEQGNPITSVNSINLYSSKVSIRSNYADGYYYFGYQDVEDGEFSIPNVVESDDYWLEVRANGYKYYSKAFILNQEEAIVLEKGAKIKGSIKTSDNKEISGITYQVYGNNTYEYGELSGGEFTIDGVDEESLTLELSFPNYNRITKTIRANDFQNDEVDLGELILQGEIFVDGNVIFNGKAIHHADIYLTKQGDRWSSYWTRSDANGYFVIRNVEEGTYTLSVEGYNLPSYEQEINLENSILHLEELFLVYESTSNAFSGEGNTFKTAKNNVVPNDEVEFRLNYQNNSNSEQDLEVSFELPETVLFTEDSILVNGKRIDDTSSYYYSNGVLYIENVAAGGKGTVSFKGIIAEDADQNIVASAQLSSGSDEEVVLTTSLSLLFATIQAPEKTASQTIKVYGKSKAGSKVKVYANNILLAETTSEGLWYSDVKLPVEAGEIDEFQLIAKVEDGSQVFYSSPTTVVYEPNIPSVTDVTINAGWNQNIKANPYKGIVTSAIVEFTPININVQFDQEIDEAYVTFLGEKYSLNLDGDNYVGSIPGTWSSYGVQLMELTFEKGDTSITLPFMEVIVLIDPSGYVFEGSMDNRLQGVNAIVEEEQPNGTWKPWNAEFFNQINPQITDQDGRYGWDVIQGNWRVIFSKNGYNTYTSRIVTVPPAETQLNVPLVRKNAPSVILTNNDGSAPLEQGEVSADSIFNIEFDRLMNIANVEEYIQFYRETEDGDVEVSGVLEAKEVFNGYKEKDGAPGYYEEDTTKQLSKVFTFTPNTPLQHGANYKVIVSSNITDYDGKTLEANQEFKFAIEEGEEPGESPGENPGEEPGENPGEEPGENPGEEAGENPGEEPGENPGEEPGENPGEEPGENPGEEPGENQGEEPSENPGEEPEQDKNEGNGNELPKTATNMYNLLLLGAMLLLIGGILFYLVNRRKA